jgi:hypothetical protein
MSSCSSSAGNGEINDELYSCHYEWEDLIKEWKSSGGGLSPSLQETRLTIKYDKVSEFAKIIRATWKSQTNSANKARTYEFGTWPIDDYQQVVHFPDYIKTEALQEKCRTFVWLNDVIWNELRFHEKSDVVPLRFKEVLANMDWASPQAQNWTVYWLLKK